ncbi:MAG TPA: hypothetical protein VFK34_11450 [Marmoricola sp.]|jgi:hypothetical protein|nr:hypothetical protein [Marmoricola sp.]
MRARPLVALRWTLPAALVGAAVVVPGAAHSSDGFDAIRAATDSFHSVAQANRAGYLDNELPCFDSPDGGMGEHLLDGDAIDDNLDPLHPEALVYEVRPHAQLRLVAVEYIVPRAPGSDAPTLLGQLFEPVTVGGMDLWTLHAWVWRDNPTGDFKAYNPMVAPCP